MFRTTILAWTTAAAAVATAAFVGAETAALVGAQTADSDTCPGTPVEATVTVEDVGPVNLAEQWGDIPDVVVIAESETAYTLDTDDPAGGDIPAVVVTAKRASVPQGEEATSAPRVSAQ